MLQTLAKKGDIRAIERELDAIEDPDWTYPAFLRRMRDMTAEYNMERIVHFLRECLDPEHDDAKPKA